MEEQKYDLLLRNGYVIDPANGISAVMDVAVKDGKIALVAPDIPMRAAKVVGYCPAGEGESKKEAKARKRLAPRLMEVENRLSEASRKIMCKSISDLASCEQ